MSEDFSSRGMKDTTNRKPATANRDGCRGKRKKEGVKKKVYNYNTTNVEKKQGVFYNTEYGRWEYYDADSVIRGGEPQPKFVSANYYFCAEYKREMEGER